MSHHAEANSSAAATSKAKAAKGAAPSYILT